MALWRVILSPLPPQPTWWSPRSPLCCGLLGRSRRCYEVELPCPSQYRRQQRNSWSWRRRPRAADGTPLSQSPAWGSEDERARARARVEGADERRRWCTASSMASERECWRRGTSMSSKHCQSGRDAAEERTAIMELVWGERPGARRSIFPTNVRECEKNARKAAGAWREALRRLTPPPLLGREAFSQDNRDRGSLRMDSKASLMITSKSG